LYSQEALEMMGVEGRVGILKIGTTWPLPTRLIVENLARTDKILFVEEVDCFLEGNVKEVLG
jgi:indolepyruvate ferredoxin oxidoreductase alpha subunit